MKLKTRKQRRMNGCGRMDRMDKAFLKMQRMWKELGINILP